MSADVACDDILCFLLEPDYKAQRTINDSMGLHLCAVPIPIRLVMAMVGNTCTTESSCLSFTLNSRDTSFHLHQQHGSSDTRGASAVYSPLDTSTRLLPPGISHLCLYA